MSDEEQDITFSSVALARLFHTIAFEKEDTRITQKSLQLTTEYLKMFTREAILRANEVRLKEAGTRAIELDVQLALDNNQEAEGSNEELVQDVLDARHLRDIAGLLILDF